MADELAPEAVAAIARAAMHWMRVGPKLAEALKSLLELQSETEAGAIQYGTAVTEIERRFDAARAAIAKAEGV